MAHVLDSDGHITYIQNLFKNVHVSFCAAGWKKGICPHEISGASEAEAPRLYCSS